MSASAIGVFQEKSLLPEAGWLGATLFLAGAYLQARHSGAKVQLPRAAGIPGNNVCAPRPRLTREEQRLFDECQQRVDSLLEYSRAKKLPKSWSELERDASRAEKLLRQLPYFDQSHPFDVESLPLVQRMATLRLRYLTFYGYFAGATQSGAQWTADWRRMRAEMIRESLAIGMASLMMGTVLGIIEPTAATIGVFALGHVLMARQHEALILGEVRDVVAQGIQAGFRFEELPATRDLRFFEPRNRRIDDLRRIALDQLCGRLMDGKESWVSYRRAVDELNVSTGFAGVDRLRLKHGLMIDVGAVKSAAKQSLDRVQSLLAEESWNSEPAPRVHSARPARVASASATSLAHGGGGFRAAAPSDLKGSAALSRPEPESEKEARWQRHLASEQVRAALLELRDSCRIAPRPAAGGTVSLAGAAAPLRAQGLSPAAAALVARVDDAKNASDLADLLVQAGFKHTNTVGSHAQFRAHGSGVTLPAGERAPIGNAVKRTVRLALQTHLLRRDAEPGLATRSS
ncbi:hypothetical protein JI739_07570 [Ramlibacter sp. AW1]|uniref:Uncharacterized protein n=1 Tax=Ramlibacter aurantiacus TaxID=2801330 RepID=A0A936ZER7_9BURK|nr:hypothetical protein [Ramlibacter aurantiacus]MBL0420204.1 hypothetical protein [Ramlibacter aurantiacus]